jgi:hypothetical protein
MASTFKVLAHLVYNLRSATILIDGLPEGQEFSMADIATLDEVRHFALRLANAAETAIEEFEGGPRAKGT